MPRACAASASGDVGRRARDFQDVVAMLVLGDIEADDLAVGRARGDHGDFASEWNKGFEDRGFGAEILPNPVRIVALADDRLALAVVAEAAGFQHGGNADARDRGTQSLQPTTHRHIRRCRSEPLHKILFGEPVLRGLEDFAVRKHRPPRRQDHRAGGGNVFEFIGDDVDVVGEQFQRLDVGIFGAGRVQHDVEGRRIRIRAKTPGI